MRAVLKSRLARIVVLLLIILLLALYVGLPLVMAFAAIAPDNSSSGSPPQGFSELTLTTSDGLSLAAWYAEPTNGAVILVVHGAGAGRSSVIPYASLLHQSGFGVLALSMRGYDESEGRINRLGWRGSTDIGAAVSFLQARDPALKIGGLGLSMGAEILLGAASAYPQISAIVAEGATFRALNEYVSLPLNAPLYRHFTQSVFTTMVQLLSGDPPPQPTLLDSMTQAASTRFLVIAAGQEDDEIAFNTFFQESLPDRCQLWVIPDAAHTGGLSVDPLEYEQRVLGFLSALLLDH